MDTELEVKIYLAQLYHWGLIKFPCKIVQGADGKFYVERIPLSEIGGIL